MLQICMKILGQCQAGVLVHRKYGYLGCAVMAIQDFLTDKNGLWFIVPIIRKYFIILQQQII